MEIRGKEEKVIYQEKMLHYGLYLPSGRTDVFKEIPWHWHREFEFGYLCEGSMEYQTEDERFLLHEGDGIFVNSGIAHCLKPLRTGRARLQVQFIDASFLAGNAGSLLDLKYIAPLQKNRCFQAVPLYRREKWSSRILSGMEEAARLSVEGRQFFELRLRNIFSEIWEELFGRAVERKDQEKKRIPEESRIGQMVSFVENRCMEKIGIEDIAACIPVSQRECYRLFQKFLGITPVKFLNSCRLQKALELLMKTEKSVLEIAVETGFGSSSYFGKMFKEYYHMTPGEYRKNRNRAAV
ncbi:MAG: AraC family transcriptional regulator [Ruminococcus sp.]|jgi:AraC-like DNA-binding protein